MDNKEEDKKERVERLASIIRMSLTTISTMIPYMDLLKEMEEQCEKSLSMATDGAIILEAMGKDSSEAENKANLELKRTRALINLLNVMEETEDSRQDFLKDKEKRDEASKQFDKLFY